MRGETAQGSSRGPSEWSEQSSETVELRSERLGGRVLDSVLSAAVLIVGGWLQRYSP